MSFGLNNNSYNITKIVETHINDIDNVILLDFSNLLVIYAYVFKNINRISINGSVVHIGVLYGFTSLIEKMLKGYPRSLFVFCMDKGYGHRKEIYPDYKSKRIVTEEKKELFSYCDKIKSVLSVIPNVFFADSEGYEGDDVVANLSFIIKDLNKNVIIHSRDYDFTQLLQYGVQVSRKFDFGKFEMITEDDVLERYGVTSKYLLYSRVLEGDSSDEIPKPIKNLKKEFKTKFVTFWMDHGYDEALKMLHKYHPKEVQRLNSKDVREKIKLNTQLMDLCKFRFEKYRIPVNLHKGSLIPSKNYIQEYDLKQYQNFLNIYFPDYGI